MQDVTSSLTGRWSDDPQACIWACGPKALSCVFILVAFNEMLVAMGPGYDRPAHAALLTTSPAWLLLSGLDKMQLEEWSIQTA